MGSTLFALFPAALVGIAPVQARAAHVTFDKPGYRLTSIGERLPVTARVVDAQQRSVPNARIVWRIADTSVAAVSPQGVVLSRRTGYTRLWAIAGGDSASAFILVEQWPAKIGFSPAALRFDAVGSASAFKVETRDAAGHALADAARRVPSCKSENDGIATIDADGKVASKSNGVTYIRCVDRGIADSLRVEVRQRPVKATIANKAALLSKPVADTFTVQLQATDQKGSPIADARPTWASLDPDVVSVNPLTGLARPLKVGTARIVAQVADVGDTVSISVQPGGNTVLFQPAPQPVDTATAPAAANAPKGPAFQITPMTLSLGDTIKATFTARDAKGAAISNPEVTLRSANSKVVAIIDSNRVVAKDTGAVWVRATFGTMKDSVLVPVRIRVSTVVSTGSFVRAAFDSLMAVERARDKETYKKSRDSLDRYIASTSTIKGPPTGRFLTLNGLVENVQHSSTPSDSVLETRSGIMFGGTAEAAPLKWIGLKGAFRYGTLNGTLPPGQASGLTGEALTVTEFSGDVTLPRNSWFALTGGYVKRAEATPTAVQQWTFTRAGAITRFDFVGGLINSVTAVWVFPTATYSDRPDGPSKSGSLAGETGLEFHLGVFSLGAIYSVEKFAFDAYKDPATSNTYAARVDQFSKLTLRFGLQAGR